MLQKIVELTRQEKFFYPGYWTLRNKNAVEEKRGAKTTLITPKEKPAPWTGIIRTRRDVDGAATLKIDRHGRAKILSGDDIQLLFSQGVESLRDEALFAVMLYTACRVSEAVTLLKRDVYDAKGKVRAKIIFRKGNTKGKLATRVIPVIQELRIHLKAYKPRDDSKWLFPGNADHKRANSHLHPDSAQWILRQACKRVGIEGVSSHSFRRTALTSMSNAGIPLRVIQEISGHRTLDELYKYLEVKEEQVLGAVSSLALLAPVRKNDFGKPMKDEVTDNSIRKRH
ncbi:site-specific integrase (plasmid) [Nostoc sp. UHCC 0302]|uniref:tyrosine-type recombinase/integrase n=1 Tax=Nostoc sp. UHCC 0302 TaxID=3134896 RepID=UPI00311C9F97